MNRAQRAQKPVPEPPSALPERARRPRPTRSPMRDSNAGSAVSAASIVNSTAIAEEMRRLYGVSYNPKNEVIVTIGASEAQNVRELFLEASPRLRRLVDFDAAVFNHVRDALGGIPTDAEVRIVRYKKQP